MAGCVKERGVGFIVLGIVALAVGAAPPVVLRETDRVGETSRVSVTLKAEGLYRPGPPPGTTPTKSEPIKPLALKVETRLEFAERVVKVDAEGRARRTVRWVVDAASAINGEVRPTAAVVRREVALLVAEPCAQGVYVFSPRGPLTRPELELVQGAGDPLALGGLLTVKPVAAGDHWRVGDETARALSAYDTIAANGLEATLETLDDETAKVRLAGEIKGTALGAEGTIGCKGTFTFDRKPERVASLTLDRTESRAPGAVEAGLDIKSTLTVTRRPSEAPAELGETALAGVSLEPDPQHELVLLVAPSGKYTLKHDRDWHTYWDDVRQTVLKRLDRGTVVAQCNLSTGPNAGKGRHQDPEQFRDDIRRALGRRFGEFLGAGEVEGDPDHGFCYKVGVQGHEGELGVIWYYFLVASPEGEQLLAAFTLAEDQAKTFGDQDLRLIGSLRWKEAAARPSPKP
jgi:hypothetical protein